MSGYVNLDTVQTQHKCPVVYHKDRYDDFIAAVRATEVRVEYGRVRLAFSKGNLYQILYMHLIDIDLYQGSSKDLARSFRQQWLDPRLRDAT